MIVDFAKQKASTNIPEEVINFLVSIGIEVKYKTITTPCVLPGLDIENGSIVIDSEQLLYPGDVLHEAGHIAVVPSNERLTLNSDDIAKRPNREAEEMMAIAWSYAACLHLNIDPAFVFHDKGYQAGGSNILENFKNGHFFGVPMLQWMGMTYERPDFEDINRPVYPKMLNWLCQ